MSLNNQKKEGSSRLPAANTGRNVSTTANSNQAEVSIQRPHRPLNAYNYFFQEERRRILRAHSDSSRASQETIGFAGMARTVSKRWKTIKASDKERYQQRADQDKERYYREMTIWYAQNNEDSDESESVKSTTVPSDADAESSKPKAEDRSQGGNAGAFEEYQEHNTVPMQMHPITQQQNVSHLLEHNTAPMRMIPITQQQNVSHQLGLDDVSGLGLQTHGLKNSPSPVKHKSELVTSTQPSDVANNEWLERFRNPEDMHPEYPLNPSQHQHWTYNFQHDQMPQQHNMQHSEEPSPCQQQSNFGDSTYGYSQVAMKAPSHAHICATPERGNPAIKWSFQQEHQQQHPHYDTQGQLARKPPPEQTHTAPDTSNNRSFHQLASDLGPEAVDFLVGSLLPRGDSSRS